MNTTHTYLFTDIEGSSRLWDRFPEAMKISLREHDRIVRLAVATHAGRVFKTAGDAFCCCFDDADTAILASVEVQRALAETDWRETGRLRVRMAISTGEADERDGDYFGPPLNRAARILVAIHGGQIVVDAGVRRAVRGTGIEWRDLGIVKLRGIERREPLAQVVVSGLQSDFPPLRVEQSGASNLPVDRLEVIGRDAERSMVVAALRDRTARLVTLSGPGGAGKTVLAIDCARQLLPDFDGTFFVDLEAVSHADRLIPAVAGVLGLREGTGVDLEAALIEYLQETSVLIVLDNVEQVRGAGQVVARLLANCDRLSVVATRREALRIRGELDLTVEPLADHAAVRLFIERATAANPRWTPSEGDDAVVRAICDRLDRLPLAIELASARVRVLSLDQMLARLDHRLPLLTGGARDLPARQQTLEATIAWSYDLLDDDDRRLVRGLSVFASGWDLGSAERLFAGLIDDLDLVDRLSTLGDRHLVVIDHGNAEPRFRMLGTIREFAAARLVEAREADGLARRHGGVFAAYAETWRVGLAGSDQSVVATRIDRDVENVRTALEYWRERGEAEPLVRMCLALVRYWRLRGALSEGQRWVTAAAEMATEETSTLARLLDESGIFAQDLGDLSAASALHERSLSIATKVEDRLGVAEAEANLATVALYRGNEAAAERLFESSFAKFVELGERRGAAAAMNGLGMVAFWQGEPSKARERYEASLVEWRALGDTHSEAIALGNLGHAVLTEGDLDSAEAVSRQALDAFEAIGDPGGVATSTLNIAFVALRRGELERAEALFRAAAAGGEEVGDPQTAIEAAIGLGCATLARGDAVTAARWFAEAESKRTRHEITLSEALERDLRDGIERAQLMLDPATFERAWNSGSALG